MIKSLVPLSLFTILVLGSLAVTIPLEGQGGGQAGTTLSAEKTAVGFFERRIVYDWTIVKSVLPTSIEIKPGNSGSVTYTLTATRTGSQTDTFGVRGQICVTNGGDRTTENLKLVDRVQFKIGNGQFQDLGGATQTIIPAQQLGPGEMQCYPYEITFTPVSGATYRNVVKVTITNHSGHLGQEFGPEPKADFSLPTTFTLVEIDEDATLTDIQNCPNGFVCTSINTGQGLSPWSLMGQPNILSDQVTISFNKNIQNVSAPCGQEFNLDNTAILTESDTGQQRQDTARVTISTGECPPPPPPPDGKGAKTIGFWKKHKTDTTSLLPQLLGNYNVDTFAKAKAVFDAAKSKNAHDMLATQLLAAKLNKANGVPSGCIDSAIITADNILVTAGYSGPNTTTPPQGSAKATVNAVKNALDAFNNFGCL